MKNTLYRWLLIGAAFALVSCRDMTGTHKAQQSTQHLIDQAVDAVVLTVTGKENITAEALTSKNISASGFDAAMYSIEYLHITGRNAQREADITFRLVKGSLHSKERTVTLTGFKAKEAAAAPTPQTYINQAVDAVVLTVTGKENITAEELTSENISASGFDAASYNIEYLNITGRNAQKEADITFRLAKGTLHSKNRTVTITDFKAKEAAAAPTPQEHINQAVDAVVLTVTGKENIFAEALTNKNISASGFDAASYNIEYLHITGRNAQKEADITFRLVKGSLHSKERTVTITGFKAQQTAVNADELIPLLGLQKGYMTASATAKKAEEKKGQTSGAFHFDDISILNYDDKAGTFTLKMTGTKNSTPFVADVSFSEFSHPLAGKHLQSLSRNAQLNFNEAIEHNTSLTKYIEAFKKDATGASFLPGYAIELDDVAHTSVSIGEHTDYRLRVRASASGTKIKLTPVLELIYRKKTDAAAAETTEAVPDTVVSPNTAKTVPYFTADDVFKHIINTLHDDFIRKNTDIFASSLYAPAVELGVTPEDVFDLTQIQKYKELYNKEKNDGTHLKLKDITAAIYNIKNGGIAADDTQGELTVTCCIATEAQIAKLSDGSSQNAAGITATKQLSRTDFKKADAAALKSMFEFKILKAEGHAAEEAKNRWIARPLPLSGQFYRLLSGKNSGYHVNNLPPIADMFCRMTINDTETPKGFFACNNPGHLSKSTNGTKILLEGVVLEKQAGEENLRVTFILSNDQPVTVTYAHSIR